MIESLLTIEMRNVNKMELFKVQFVRTGTVDSLCFDGEYDPGSLPAGYFGNCSATFSQFLESRIEIFPEKKCFRRSDQRLGRLCQNFMMRI